MCPNQTAARHASTEARTLAPAYSHSPSFTRLSVCRLNEEKVVSPADAYHYELARGRADEDAAVGTGQGRGRNPITKEPTMLMSRVPQGEGFTHRPSEARAPVARDTCQCAADSTQA